MSRNKEKGSFVDVGRPPRKKSNVGGDNMPRRGVKGGSLQGKREEASSSNGPVNKTRATRVAWMAGSRFKYLFS